MEQQGFIYCLHESSHGSFQRSYWKWWGMGITSRKEDAHVFSYSDFQAVKHKRRHPFHDGTVEFEPLAPKEESAKEAHVLAEKGDISVTKENIHIGESPY